MKEIKQSITEQVPEVKKRDKKVKVKKVKEVKESITEEVPKEIKRDKKVKERKIKSIFEKIEKKKPKNWDAPSKVPSPFFCFQRKTRAKFEKAHPDLSQPEVIKAMTTAWKLMNEK